MVEGFVNEKNMIGFEKGTSTVARLSTTRRHKIATKQDIQRAGWPSPTTKVDDPTPGTNPTILYV